MKTMLLVLPHSIFHTSSPLPPYFLPLLHFPNFSVILTSSLFHHLPPPPTYLLLLLLLTTSFSFSIFPTPLPSSSLLPLLPSSYSSTPPSFLLHLLPPTSFPFFILLTCYFSSSFRIPRSTPCHLPPPLLYSLN